MTTHKAGRDNSRATKDDDIEERVGTETVRTVNGDTRRLTGSVETWHDLVLAILFNPPQYD